MGLLYRFRPRTAVQSGVSDPGLWTSQNGKCNKRLCIIHINYNHLQLNWKWGSWSLKWRKTPWRTEGARLAVGKKGIPGQSGFVNICQKLLQDLMKLGKGTVLSSDSPKTAITVKDCFQKSCFPQIFPASPVGLEKHPMSTFCSTSNSAWLWTSSLGPYSDHLLSVQTFGFATAVASRFKSVPLSNSEHCLYKTGRPCGTSRGGIYDSEANLYEPIWM